MDISSSMVMDRALQHRAQSPTQLRGRTGGPTLCVGGAQPGAEHL
jgi:hypothetical protein